jgi:two-component system LytT family sensor kinase
MENIRRYMEIERVRFGELLNYEEEIAADCEKSIVPALILLPLYENAIKHGLYESLDPVTVRTKCFRKGNNLFVVVSNNFDASASSPVGTGLGLKHTANILRNLFGRDGLLVAGASDGIYTVRICIPQS